MSIAFSLATPPEMVECNNFYNKQYGASRTIEQMAWEFQHGPHEPLYAIARDGERLVATQALISIDLATPHGRVLSAKSEETLVDGDYRGQGVFENLYEFVLHHARARGIQVIWGFTPAVKPFLRAGFGTPAMTSQVVLPIRTGFVAALGQSRDVKPPGGKFTGSVGERALLSVGAVARAYDRLAKELQPDGISLQYGGPELIPQLAATQSENSRAVTILRSRQYLSWRLGANPYVSPNFVVANSDSGVQGWAAFATSPDGVGYLVDLVVCTDSHARTVIRRRILGAYEFFVDQNPAAFRGWVVTNNEQDVLVRRQFQRLGGVHLKKGMPMVLKVVGNDFRDLGEPDRWQVTRIFTEGVSG